jgi:hypothetical protein
VARGGRRLRRAGPDTESGEFIFLLVDCLWVVVASSQNLLNAPDLVRDLEFTRSGPPPPLPWLRRSGIAEPELPRAATANESSARKAVCGAARTGRINLTASDKQMTNSVGWIAESGCKSGLMVAVVRFVFGLLYPSSCERGIFDPKVTVLLVHQ